MTTSLLFGENGKEILEMEGVRMNVWLCSTGSIYILVEYDKNGEIIGKKKKKVEMNVITAIQREESYEPFERSFYPNDSNMVTPEIAEWEKKHGIEIHSLQSVSTESNSSERLPLPHSYGRPSTL